MCSRHAFRASRSGARPISSSWALPAAALLAALAVPAVGQQQFDELRRELPLAQEDTSSVVLGDVDGDGDLDLVSGNYQQQNRLYLNDGSGTFLEATASRLPVGGHATRCVALGDVDGDGDRDLLSGNYDQQNRLYLNDGGGTFVDATASRLPVIRDYTESVRLGDIDGDGDLDLICGNVGQNRLHLNDGSGTFIDATASRMPGNRDATRSAVLGDVDGDGDLDLVCGNGGWGWPQNRLYLNDGGGSFVEAPASRLPPASNSTTSVVIADVEGDGDLDLLWGNVGQNRLYLNDGGGTFVDSTASHMPVDSDATESVVPGDIDGDGDLDVVVGNRGRNRLYLNDGGGTFSDGTDTRMPVYGYDTRAVVLGDVNGSGDLDLVSGNHGQQNRLYANDGGGTFRGAITSRVPFDSDSTASVALGDVDGDDDLDLVCGNSSMSVQQNRLYLNDGSGSFTDATASRMPSGRDDSWCVVLADVDADGDLDVVWGNNGQNRLYLNDGSGLFADATVTRMPADRHSTRSAVLGDVDGDGDLDLLCGNSGRTWGQQNRLYLNDGGGTFSDVTASRLPVDTDVTRSVVLGDVDGDGDLDLVCGNSGVFGQLNRLYLNDGRGTFTDATAIRVPFDNDATLSVVLGDVDGDGDLDLVCGNSIHRNRLYLNDGTGTFRDATASRLPADTDATRSVVLGDVDVDGDLDLVCANLDRDQQNRLYLNDGSGTFSDVTSSRLPVDLDLTRSVVLGNVDGDGDLDLVCANDGQNRLYLNLWQQLDAPFRPHIGRTYTFEVYARYGPASSIELALPHLSTRRISVPLPPFGVLGIDPMVEVPPIVIHQPAGMGSVSVPVPDLPSMVGVTIYTQALIVRHPHGARLSNVTADVIIG